MTTLAQCLAAHPRWKWHIGMVAESTRVYDVGKAFTGYEVPDVHHPATKGWLLAMLREAAVCVQVHHDPVDLSVYADWVDAGFVTRRDWFHGDDALAAALLATWGER